MDPRQEEQILEESGRKRLELGFLRATEAIDEETQEHECSGGEEGFRVLERCKERADGSKNPLFLE